MKTIIIWILVVMLVGGLIYSGVLKSERDKNNALLEEQKRQEFFKECFEKRGKLETIGSTWTTLYLICNPNKCNE